MDSPSSTEHADKTCAAGCGFFGTAANNGFCSKCYAATLTLIVEGDFQEVVYVPSDQPESSRTKSGNKYVAVPSGQPESSRTKSVAKSAAVPSHRSESSPTEPVARSPADLVREVAAADVQSDQPESESVAVVKKKKRCGSCSKKIGMLGFKCKCGVTFCGAHRHPEEHACGYDFREAGRVLIRKENPVCRADKIEYRL